MRSNLIKTNLVLLISILIMFSCTNRNKLEELFITPKNHYWQITNNNCWENISHLVPGYVNFTNDSLSNQYGFDPVSGFEIIEGDVLSDVIVKPRKWYVKKDSVLSWGDSDYKIKQINKSVIILSYLKDKKTCTITMLKVSGEK